MSKVVKYTSRQRDIINDQLNTIYISISFLKFFWRGGGGAKFNFAPGRQLPSLRHWSHAISLCVKFCVTFKTRWTILIMIIL